MTAVRDELEAHLHRMSAPFLFVGSGVGRRYAGTDDWQGLLRRFAGLAGRPYEYFVSSAGGHLPTIASSIAAAFHDVWWTDDRFASSREEWAHRVTGPESALKVEVARHLAGAALALPTEGMLADELALLRRAVVDGVITTNYDPILENLFPDFRVFVGQEGLLFSDPQGVGELYKIHGSCDDPDSLVLTAADYARFDERNAYLAAKLLTTFVEHPVVFLGYSLQDDNVIGILRSIAQCMTQANIDQLRDRLIFVQWQDRVEPSVGPHTMLVDGFVINVLRVTVPDYLEVFEVLTGLRRALPAAVLRRLKEQVYQLVLTDDPQERLFVTDLDGDRADDVDVVFGVGMGARLGQQGYIGLTRWDLVDDVLGADSRFDAGVIVDQVLPVVLRSPGNVPVYKYLRGAGVLGKNGVLKRSAAVNPKVAAMADKIRAGMPASAWHAKKAPQVLKNIVGLAQLESDSGVNGVLNYAALLAPSKIDPGELRAWLISHPEIRDDVWGSTQYVKLVCHYDWLVNGRTAGG